MNTQRKNANSVGGMTARACESCLIKRARWYCAADEAFLCQSCDASVHSANLLASRHERVRLETASCKISEPAWHKGFTRKARTPRYPNSKHVQGKEEKIVNSFPLVPEIGGEDGSPLDGEEEVLYCVPVFHPFDADICNNGYEVEKIHAFERRETCVADQGQGEEACVVDDLHGFFQPDDINLLETLLGTGTGDEACGMEGLGLLDCEEEEEDVIGIFYDEDKVKVEDDEVQAILTSNIDYGFDMTRDKLDWNFDYESPVNVEEGEKKQKVVTHEETTTMMGSRERKEEAENKISLSLNYEGVMAAWANQDSPWTTGRRPESIPDDCWPDFMGIGSVGMNRPYGETGGRDGVREARVMRYREKRRTRLFSKKIRYEVRKLNAEKRPRMKGRFVKRTSFATGSSDATAFPNYMMMK